MAISFGLTYYGSSTTTLGVHDYQQVTFGDDDEFVSETIPVDVTEASAALVDAKLTLLHRLSGAVAEYQKTKVANQPVYLTATVDSVAWRSEIVAMRVTNESTHAYQDEHASFRRSVILEVTRRPWESVTEYAAQLRNPNVTDWDTYDPTAGEYGIRVYSGYDQSGTGAPVDVTHRINLLFVKENAAAPAMSMNTPVKIVFSEGQNGIYYDEFYIGQKNHCGIAGQDYLADGALKETSVTAADTTCSNNNYYTLAFSGGYGKHTPTTALLFGDLVYQENKFYKAFIRFRATFAYTDLRCRLVFEDFNFTNADLWTGQWFTLTPGKYLYALDTLKIPVTALYDAGYINPRNYRVRIEFKSAVASRTVYIDCVYFIGADGYAELEKRAEYASYTTFGVSDNKSLMVDFATNPPSTILGGIPKYLPTNGWPVMVVRGPGIYLMPSQNTYSTAIYFLFTRTTDVNYPDDYVHVNVFYRPRRRAI